MAGHAQQVTLSGRAWGRRWVGERRQRAAGLKRSQWIFFGSERRRGDERAPADLTPQIPFIDQSLVGARDRFWRDAECCCQPSHRWQSLARSQ